MTKRFHRPTIVLLTVSSLLLGIAASTSNPTPLAQAAANPIRLAQAKLIVEVNATDGDAGLQLFLDGKAWRSMTVFDPDGRTILAVNAEGRLMDFGLTELFSESSEPPFDVFPLEDFKALFPAGKYTLVGTTVEGEKVVGKATLTHDFPDGPEIVSPADGASVGRANVVARWNPVAEPPGIDVVGYRVIVTRENPLRVFSVDLPAGAGSMPIPPEFLESGTEYKLEVQAIEASGNQTLTEIIFLVN